MATSGVATWNPVLQSIIRKALLNVGAIDELEAPRMPLYQDALTTLNGLVKSMETTGIHVWAEAEGILFPQPGVPRYEFFVDGSPINPAGRACQADGWARYLTTAGAAQGATQIEIADTALITAGGAIGILLATNVIQWGTVVSVVDGTTLEVAALAAPVNQGAYVIYIADGPSGRAIRPLKVPRARLLLLSNLNETPMTILSRQEYMDLPQKTSPGTPTQWFYSPQRDTGLFYIWPVPVQAVYAIRYTYYRPLQDFLEPTDTADFPQEWVLPLQWMLSKELMTGYGVDQATEQRITRLADEWLDRVQSYDRESEPIQFGMDDWQFGGDAYG